MEARISSIRLKKNDNGLYWEITLVDENNCIIGTFGNENCCSDIDFRNQTFYIMKILNNWDLLKLDSQEKSFPVLVDNEFYSIEYIANAQGDYLYFDYITGEVILGSGLDVSQFCQRYVTSLESKSGVFMSCVKDKYSLRYATSSLAYHGFKDIYPQHSEEIAERGAHNFRNFVYGILKICGTEELIQSNNYPPVSVKYDSNGNIIAIGNINGDEYLYITENGYTLSGDKIHKR